MVGANSQVEAAKIVASTVRKKPSLLKEIFYGLSVGILGGLVWKSYHMSMKRHTEWFYEALDRGEITVVVKKHDVDKI
ncbi:hypothetical protein O6H91_01G041200 [Diphasiastrum complanatum]|uniref:Uncharacterized protein n=1 Tax=Diphasiastrum complanatum TaxID=34168 RepID=A0ACC2EQ95_DIPCM|nr:hypothetical protein O6H91_01G041200 [Diphasiastrum complanatum]